MVFHNRTKTKTITVEDLNNPENGNTLEMKFNRKGELFRIKRNGQVVDPMTKDFENLEDNRVVMQAYVDVNIELDTSVGRTYAHGFGGLADDTTIVETTKKITIDRIKRDVSDDDIKANSTISSNKTVSSNFDLKTGQAYINGEEVSADEFTEYINLSEEEQLRRYGVETPIQPSVSEGYGDEIPLDITLKNKDKRGIVREYKVFHSDKNGTTIRAVDADGNLLPNRKPVYRDGVWDKSQISQQNPFFPPSENLWSDLELKLIDEAVRKETGNFIETTNPNGIKPAWIKNASDFSVKALKNASRGARGIFNNEFWQGSENYPTSGTNAGSGPGYDGASGQGLRAMNATLKAFAGAEEEDSMFKKIVKYPMDMAHNMDHMFIQCYSYRAPYAKTFDGKYGEGFLQPGKQRETGLAFGAERYSPYKKKLGAGIKLPMPNNIQDGNGRSWNEESMTNQQMSGAQIAGKNVIGSLLTGDLFGTGPTIRKMATQGELLTQESTRGLVAAEKIAQLAADTGLTAEQIMQRSVGVVANSNTELLFAGVMLRSFEYQWRLSPRNRLEAANVRMIIRALKQWSAPKKTRKVDRGGKTNVGKAGGPSFFLGTPNIFRLRFVTNGNRNILGVNKFKPCALTNIDLNYTAEGQWLAYENGMPVAIDMTLRFAELEPIYDTDYSDDVAEDRRYDANDPESTGDLYPISKVDQSSPYGADIGY